MQTNPSEKPVVAVCGAEARVYGPVNEFNRRPLWNIKQFAHHGAAVLYAQEYEDDKSSKGTGK